MRKRLPAFFSLLTICLLLAQILPGFSTQKAAADTTDPATDLKRQIMIAAKECFDRTDVIETGDSHAANDAAGLYDTLPRGDDYGKPEKIVVGFQVDGDNGVETCFNLMPKALGIAHAKAYNVTATDDDSGKMVMVQQYILQGSSFISGTKYKAQNHNNSNSQVFSKILDDAINKIPQPDQQKLLVPRVAPLVGSCFGFTKDANPPTFDENKGSFKVDGLGTFLQKQNMKPSDYSWIKSNDGFSLQDNHSAIGSIELSWGGNSFQDFTQNNSDSSADFWPIGTEISQTSGYTANSIVDCHFIKKNAGWIFGLPKLWGADANGNVTYNGQTISASTVKGVPASTVPHVDCETGNFTSIGGIADHAVSWILCPLLDGAQAIVNTVGGWVVDQLEFDVNGYLIKPITVNDANGNPTKVLPIKDAWNAFRVISLTLVILVALAGILMSNFIDAYTLKKILPRILIAIIAISLSWDLMILAINVTNSVGNGIRALIDLPFKILPNATINPLLILGGAGAAAGLTTILGALSFVGTAALAVLFAFIFTILRVGAIIALIIFAPVAILLWILPGTQKGWNFWQQGLLGALLMFPIVTAFLSIGAAFGKIIYNMSPGSPINQTIALVATYAPYFLIPKAFSMAGGVVSNLAGMVNDRGRGAFDRLKKFRQGQGEKRRADIKSGKFFKGGNAENFRGKFSKHAQSAFLAPSAGLDLRDPNSWGTTLAQARSNANAATAHEAIQKDADFQRVGDNDDTAKVAEEMALGKYTKAGVDQSVREELLRLDEADEHGNYKYHDTNTDGSKGAVNRAALDAKMAELAPNLKYGDERAAERLQEVNPVLYAGEDENSKTNLKNALISIKRVDRRYGAGVVAEATFAKRATSSTAWQDDYEVELDSNGLTRKYQESDKNANGVIVGADGGEHKVGEIVYKYDDENEKIVIAGTAAGKMVREAAEVAHGDEQQAINNALLARKGQEQANRKDISGAGASDTVKAVNMMVEAIHHDPVDVQATLIKTSEDLNKAAARGKSIHEQTQGGKKASARGLLRGHRLVREERVSIAKNIYDRNISQANANIDPVQRARLIAEAETKYSEQVIRAQALESMAHAAFAQSSPDAAKESGDYYNESVNFDDYPPQLASELRAKLGAKTRTVTKTVANPNFNTQVPISTSNPATVEVKEIERYDERNVASRGEINDVMRDNAAWRAYQKEYGATAAQAEQARAAAIASGASAEQADAAAADIMAQATQEH